MDKMSFYIITNEGICYGILQQFGYSLAESIRKLGHEVYTSDGKYGGILNTEQFLNKKWTAIIGFQARGLELDVVRQLPCLKLQFIVDHPSGIPETCCNYNDDAYLLCLDKNYAKYAQKYRNSANAIFFPPAGKYLEFMMDEKEYDVQFIGGYFHNTIDQEHDEFKIAFYEYMLNHASLDYTTCMQYFLKSLNVDLSSEEFDAIMCLCWQTYMNGISYVKYSVIHSLIKEGIRVHVYGASWKNFSSLYSENLIIHEEVSAERGPIEYSKAKIGLNIMSWHKQGMTERVAQIMLGGAVCVSDETTVLCEEFKDGEDICLFKITDIPKMVNRVKELLHDDKKREEIARRGYEKAVRKHTWDVRAKQLVEFVEKELKNRQ